MPNFQLSSLDGYTTPKKILQICVLKKKLRKSKQNDSIYFLLNSILLKKNIEIFQKTVINGQFVIFEVVKNHQNSKTVLIYIFLSNYK